jgi:hypothetical protein
MSNEIAIQQQSESRLQVNAREITTASGKVSGQRFTYAGKETPAEMKSRLKLANPELSSRAVSTMVTDIMKGNTTLAWAETAVINQYLQSIGAVPVTTDLRSKSAVTRFVIPTESKAKKKEDPEAIRKEAFEKAVSNLMAKIGCNRAEAIEYLS